MQVSDWWMFLSFYQNVLAVPVAIVVFVLLIRAKAVRRRALYGALIVVLFLPHIQRFAGDYYFDYLCRTQAGEFIYRTVDNVEGILQMRPRDGSKDYFDRMRAGDIPEDPWGHTNVEAKRFRAIYVGPPGTGRYSYIELKIPFNDSTNQAAKYEKYSVRIIETSVDGKVLAIQQVKEVNTTPSSLYGYTWEEISRPLAHALNIHVGRVKVVDLEEGSTLAEKVGLLRTRPWRTCPETKTEDFLFQFIAKVLKPGGQHGNF